MRPMAHDDVGTGIYHGSSPAPQISPGLGTEWGETRDSPLRDVAFYRANALSMCHGVIAR